jgi:hypothetical protein
MLGADGSAGRTISPGGFSEVRTRKELAIMAIPILDTALVPFITNFKTRIAGSPGEFGISAGDATQLGTLADTYLALQLEVVDLRAAGYRVKSVTASRDAARGALLPFARQLYASVQASTTVTVSNKELLGIVVPKTHYTPEPAPAVSPQLVIESVVGRTIKGRLCVGAKPQYALNATLLTFVGTAPPDATGDWKMEGQTGKTTFEVTFPPSVAPGTTVYLTAYWTNRKGDSSIACTPVGWTFGAAGVENNGSLKLAA